MDICNEFPVTTPQPNRNEAILARYSVEDGAGTPHPHLNWYGFAAEYTPRAVPGAPDSQGIVLKPDFSGFDPISQQYSRTTPPVMEAENLRSVIVPSVVEGWPPEPNGDLPPQCQQYALEVSLRCNARTVDGWSRIFGTRHVSRHIIIKRT